MMDEPWAETDDFWGTPGEFDFTSAREGARMAPLVGAFESEYAGRLLSAGNVLVKTWLDFVDEPDIDDLAYFAVDPFMERASQKLARADLYLAGALVADGLRMASQYDWPSDVLQVLRGLAAWSDKATGQDLEGAEWLPRDTLDEEEAWTEDPDLSGPVPRPTPTQFRAKRPSTLSYAAIRQERS